VLHEVWLVIWLFVCLIIQLASWLDYGKSFPSVSLDIRDTETCLKKFVPSSHAHRVLNKVFAIRLF